MIAICKRCSRLSAATLVNCTECGAALCPHKRAHKGGNFDPICRDAKGCAERATKVAPNFEPHVVIRSSDDMGVAYHLSRQAVAALGELHATGLYGSGNVADVALLLLLRALREEVVANRRAARGPAAVRGR